MVNELLEQIVTVCELESNAVFYKRYRLDKCFYFEVFYDLRFVMDKRVEYIDFRTVNSFKAIRIYSNEDVKIIYY